MNISKIKVINVPYKDHLKLGRVNAFKSIS